MCDYLSRPLKTKRAFCYKIVDFLGFGQIEKIGIFIGTKFVTFAFQCYVYRRYTAYASIAKALFEGLHNAVTTLRLCPNISWL